MVLLVSAMGDQETYSGISNTRNLNLGDNL